MRQPTIDLEQIYVITTRPGQNIIERRLLSDGILAQLCTDIGILAVPRIDFHLICDANGRPLDDVRNRADNTALANTIMGVVRSLTADPERRVHASLSGGRKTMSFYLGYAMSLYGRPQDALYHVMVPVEFESCPDFFYISSTEEVSYC